MDITKSYLINRSVRQLRTVDRRLMITPKGKPGVTRIDAGFALGDMPSKVFQGSWEAALTPDQRYNFYFFNSSSQKDDTIEYVLYGTTETNFIGLLIGMAVKGGKASLTIDNQPIGVIDFYSLGKTYNVDIVFPVILPQDKLYTIRLTAIDPNPLSMGNFIALTTLRFW